MTKISHEQATFGFVQQDPDSLQQRFREVRGTTESLCQCLENEDYVLQSMPDASPTKWHLAHTSWFFDTFLLSKYLPDYQPFHPQFKVLFNSYYNSVGEQFARPERGMLSRPSVGEVYDYRHAVDEAISNLLEQDEIEKEVNYLLEVGLNHEQQHQELLLTDIKHAFSCNPLLPSYLETTRKVPSVSKEANCWKSIPTSEHDIGHCGEGFCYDNETPKHRCLVHGFEIQSQLVTVSDYLSFIEEGGYQTPRYWLSDGWAYAQQQGWQAPLYWHQYKDVWQIFTLNGTRSLILDEPVAHLSYYEADAYARWAGARLPTEIEWEVLASNFPIQGNFLENEAFHPIPAQSAEQIFGDVWEWTASPYTAYPNYKPLPGALGEYNGKFMCNQIVLRGGSCVTPQSHLRRTYRNFLPPHSRWQFSGLRLARNV